MTKEKGLVKGSAWTKEQVELITRTVAKGATMDELGLFFNVAKRAKLDPFLRQIHLVASNTKMPDGTYATVRTVQVGIDGFRAIAERTKQYAGSDDAIFDEGAKYEPGKEPKNPTKATVTDKTTPVDADVTLIEDSAASGTKKKLTWANIKAALKTYFDTVYSATGHSHTGTYEPADSNIQGHISDTADPHGSTLEQSNLKVTGQAYFDGEVDNSNSGASKTIDWSAGNKQKITLTGACAFTFTAPSGPCNLVLRVIANGTAYTPTWPSTVKWPGGTAPTLTSTNAKWDVLAFYYDGTNYSAVTSQNFG